MDPRPLALHARKVKDDREIKLAWLRRGIGRAVQANAKANVFTGYDGPQT